MVSIKYIAHKNGIPPEMTTTPVVVNLLNGSISGAIAGYLTNPFDVVKTRLMTVQSKHGVSEDDDTQGKSRRNKIGMWSSITTIIEKEGFTALFLGAHVRMLQLCIDSFTYFGTYETVKDYILSTSVKDLVTN